jgi:hypothetical protein
VSSAGSRAASGGPIPYRLNCNRRLLDETALAGIVYGADVNIGRLSAIIHLAFMHRRCQAVAS